MKTLGTYKCKQNLRLVFEFDGTQDMAFELDYKFRNIKIEKDICGEFVGMSILGVKLKYDESLKIERYMECYLPVCKGDVIIVNSKRYVDVTCDKKYSVSIKRKEIFYKNFVFYKDFNIDFYLAKAKIYSELSLKPQYDIVHNVFMFDGTKEMTDSLIKRYNNVTEYAYGLNGHTFNNVYLTTKSGRNVRISNGCFLLDFDGHLVSYEKDEFESNYELSIVEFDRNVKRNN